MKIRKLLFAISIIALLSFTATEKKTFEFNYSKQKEANISLVSDHFKKFKGEWRGSDYYYFAENDGFICSVLFYKLDEQEKRSLVEVPKVVFDEKAKAAGKSIPDNCPVFAYSYFKNYSQLKSMEKEDESWGGLTDEFMFRKNYINIEGTSFTQTHMYGYAMFGTDLFVNVHLSKMNCSEADLKEMTEILNSLKKIKE